MPNLRFAIGLRRKKKAWKKKSKFVIPKKMPNVNQPVSVWCSCHIRISGTSNQSTYVNYYMVYVWECLFASETFKNFRAHYNSYRPLKVSSTINWAPQLSIKSEHGTYTIRNIFNCLHNTPCLVNPLGGAYWLTVMSNLGVATAPAGRTLKQKFKLTTEKNEYHDVPMAAREFGAIHTVAMFDNAISPISSDIPTYGEGTVRVKVLFLNPINN